MKKFTFLALVSLLTFASFESSAQKKQSVPATETKKEAQQSEIFRRCGTMEALEMRMKNDPAYRAQYEQSLRDFENRVQTTQRTSTLTDTVIIPVVVHIVLPNPNIVTDADVQFFIDRLNKDFSGFNADSANGAPFYNVRGHSLIRFVPARRDPNGALTNGIERRVGTGLIAGGEPQAIKSAASGLAPWPFQQYYNLWVGDGGPSGLLGIAPEIGVGTAASDGVCVDYRAFASNPCFTYSQYNLARTAVHEVGHNFGLFHTFQGTCSNADFQQLTTPSQQLPAELLEPSDDTPAQNNSSSGCPTPTLPTGCANFPDPPGRMYQNYMDYSNDLCYSMFSDGQVARMHYVLENFRSGYLTTQGHIPPAGALTLDALPFESVNPGGYEINGCTVTTYPATANCPGPIVPKFRFRNNGLTVLNSITVGMIFNNGTAVTQTLTGLNMPVGTTRVVTFSTVTLLDGANSFKFFTSLPNGAADQNPANDTLTTNLNVTASPLPVFEGFEGAFPPAPWTVISVNTIGTRNWVKKAPGRNSASSMFIENWNNSNGAIDDFRSGSFAANPTDVVTISFDLAYKFYGSGTTTSSPDTLAVLVSSDCGVTFTEVYKKWGTTLATAGGQTANYLTPVAADWKTETLTIPAAALASGKFQVIFRSKSRFGNNIFIDNINIQKKYDRDIKLVSIISPTGNVCSNTVTPQVQVTNNGTQAINSFQVNYTVGGVAAAPVTINTPLAVGATTTVTLPAVSVIAGAQAITINVSNVVFASGLAEEDVTNNSLTGNFTVVTLRTTVSESFETAPVGWTVSNPDANNTWVISTPGRNSARSAFINNYDFDVVGNIDDLRSPFINTAGIDSLFITFDLSHKNYDGYFDNLSILAVTGCGTVFTPTGYSKSGATLSTAGSSTASFLTPGPNDWRTERVAIGANVMGAGGNALIAFRNTNDYGNNIFIDNVNIFPLYKRDLQLLSINQPADIICTATFTPSVTIKNNGSDTITGYKISYSIDNGAVQTTTISGVSIPRNATAVVSLTPATVAVGAHTFRVYSWEPIGPSGTGDNNPVNDTLSKAFSYAGTVSAPLVEGFEGTQFPPVNWAVANSDGATTWQRAGVGNNSTGSAYVNNFGYTGAVKQKDDLATPVITYPAADSVKLMFDLSAATRQFPGAARLDLDTLEVMVTRDCGATFTSVYKKWGAELQTLSDPNIGVNAAFTPNSPAQWRTETIDLTAFANVPSLQVYFRNTTAKGNNIYIDNVNFSTRILPARLKEQGYLVLPTAFTSQFSIWFLQNQTAQTLRYVTVYNAGGQMVYKKEFNGNAQRVLNVDLSSQPAGVYFVNLGYTDEQRNVTERVIKR